MLGRRIGIVTDPDAGGEVGGVTDEPRVAEILAGAGLSAAGQPEIAALTPVPISTVACSIRSSCATLSLERRGFGRGCAVEEHRAVGVRMRHDVGVARRRRRWRTALGAVSSSSVTSDVPSAIAGRR